MVQNWRAAGLGRKPIGWRNESYRHYLSAKGVSTNRYEYKKNTLNQFILQNDAQGVRRPRLSNAYVQRRAGDTSVPEKTTLESLRPGQQVVVELAKQKPKKQVRLRIVNEDQRADWYVGEVQWPGTPLRTGDKVLFKRKNVLRIE